VINGVYNMGPIALKAQYGQVTADAGPVDVDADKWAIGADYSLSKRTTAYLVYVSDDIDVAGVDATNGWGLGVKHSF
jgi:predicted porin